MANSEEKKLLRELAKRYLDLARMPVNEERKERMKRTNDLTPGLRPAVWIDEIPWHEMDIDGQLSLVCEDPFARRMEWFFKSQLYRWKYIQADMVLLPYYAVHKKYSSTGNGLDTDERIIKTDSRNHIVSHAYHDMLATEEQLAKMKMPMLTACPENDRKNVEMAEDILNGILPAKLTGHQFYYSPWDTIATLRGVEPILIDMIDRPEFLHKIVSRFAEHQAAVMDQMEALNLLDAEPVSLHCTPAFTDDLPKPAPDGKVRQKNVWFRAMAQMFNVVSPAMHEEFELQYMRPLMQRCGLVYYGCCEPLDNKIDLLKTVPNMRKIGVSPWSNQERSAEQMESRYVFARKPNPAFVAGTFDAETVRREIRETVELCIRYKCPYEFVLKDISTVSYKPQNLIQWNQVVQEVLDHYYR